LARLGPGYCHILRGTITLIEHYQPSHQGNRHIKQPRRVIRRPQRQDRVFPSLRIRLATASRSGHVARVASTSSSPITAGRIKTRATDDVRSTFARAGEPDAHQIAPCRGVLTKMTKSSRSLETKASGTSEIRTLFQCCHPMEVRVAKTVHLIGWMHPPSQAMNAKSQHHISTI